MRSIEELNIIADALLQIHTNQRNLDWNGTPGGVASKELIEAGECAWPELALTMIGRKRLLNIGELCNDVVAKDIRGGFCECGVWRGGACIMARACLPIDRKVWVCDSFCGFPKTETELHWLTYKVLEVSRAEVEKNFEKYSQTEGTRFVEGYFSTSLSQINEPLSILRLDADSEENTRECLSQLWPKVSVGGYVIFDEFFIESVQRAIRTVLGTIPETVQVDRMCSFIKKA